VSLTLLNNFEALTLSASGGAIDGTGNALGNVILGNDSVNIINGAGGDDDLTGAGGNDALTGGTGDDAFIFALGSGQDTVSDFVAGGAEDSLDLSGYDGSGVTWQVNQVGADTVFAFSNGDQVTLLNVTSGDLIHDGLFGYS
jgi:Ca2+-binding RTX toxin-like protein